MLTEKDKLLLLQAGFTLRQIVQHETKFYNLLRTFVAPGLRAC